MEYWNTKRSLTWSLIIKLTLWVGKKYSINKKTELEETAISVPLGVQGSRSSDFSFLIEGQEEFDVYLVRDAMREPWFMCFSLRCNSPHFLIHLYLLWNFLTIQPHSCNLFFVWPAKLIPQQERQWLNFSPANKLYLIGMASVKKGYA